MVALGAVLTACDEVEPMTGVAQSNPQLPLYEASDLDLAQVVGNDVNLPAINSTQDKNVAIFRIDSLGPMPDDYTMAFKYQIASTDEFADAQEMDVTTDETTGYVTTSQLETAYEGIFGLSEETQKVYGRVLAYASNSSGSLIRIGGENQYYVESSFELAPDPVFVLYTPGNSNNWSFDASQQLTSKDGKTYEGFAYLNGEFKFTNAPDWDGTNYGADGELTYDADKDVYTGTLSTDGSAGNINAPAEGLYFITVSTADLSFTLTPITTVGVIGDAVPTGWDADTTMTPSDNYLVWTVTIPLNQGEFKFRFNGSWDLNLGGSLDNLEIDGSNIPVSAAEDATITLDLSSVPYKATVE